MFFNIQTIAGVHTTVEGEPSDTVDTLRKKIYNKLGIPPTH